MNKDEIIALLQQQNSFLQEQLQEANRKADALLEEVIGLLRLLCCDLAGGLPHLRPLDVGRRLAAEHGLP